MVKHTQVTGNSVWPLVGLARELMHNHEDYSQNAPSYKIKQGTSLEVCCFYVFQKLPHTLREKCSNTEFFSGPYFPAFRLNTRIRENRTWKNSVFGHFSRSDRLITYLHLCCWAKSIPLYLIFKETKTAWKKSTKKHTHCK